MTYSSAIFSGASDTLTQGQLAKYDRILDRLEGSSKDLLEIGAVGADLPTGQFRIGIIGSPG